MRWVGALRQEISTRNQDLALVNNLSHEMTRAEVPSVIFDSHGKEEHGNFHPISYRNIRANPEWSKRLMKAHTGWKRALSPEIWRWRELDCANSSDALLMNVFCYRRTVNNPALCSMLGVQPGLVPQFGFRPRVAFRNGGTDRTEVDMKLGHLLIEAKLTEGDFQTASLRLIKRYRDIEEVFVLQDLKIEGDIIRNYQLIRGVLAAFATGESFCVLCDERRPDLIDNWYRVISAVRNCDLRCRLKLLTWQEVSSALPGSLREFLAAKYGITH